MNLMTTLNDNLIFIPGQIPSLKNTKIMGKFQPKTVTQWLRLFGIQNYSIRRKEVNYFKTIKGEYNIQEIVAPLRIQIDKYLETNTYPIKLGLHFVRKTKRSWDFHNICQILFDIFTTLEVIPDDDVNHVLPFPLLLDGKWYSLDKDNPGVYIKVLT